jgi:hypothetical protein
MKIPQVSGRSIISADGKPMLWRGIGLGCWLLPEGYMMRLGGGANAPRQIDDLIRQLIGDDASFRFWHEFREHFITRADIALIKRLGFDHIRIPFSTRLLSPDEYPRRLAGPGWDLIDRCIGWCRDAGLGVVLDMHGAPGGQTGDNIDDSPGHPFIYEDEDSQHLACAIWAEFARRYRDEPTVWAYELFNEPIAHHPEIWSPEMGARLEPLYKRMTAAIRAIDKNRIVILGGARWNTDFSVFSTPFDPQLVYAFHRYFMPLAPGLMNDYVDFSKKHNVPVWLGETGENTMDWIQGIREQAEAADIGWNFWTYKRISADGRCVTSIKEPAGWEAIVDYAKAPRSTFDQIRKHRPPFAAAKAALRGYLDAIRVDQCQVNPEYMKALGLSRS